MDGNQYQYPTTAAKMKFLVALMFLNLGVIAQLTSGAVIKKELVPGTPIIVYRYVSEDPEVSQEVPGDADNNKTSVFRSGPKLHHHAPEVHNVEKKSPKIDNSDSQEIDLYKSTEDPETSSVGQKISRGTDNNETSVFKRAPIVLHSVPEVYDVDKKSPRFDNSESQKIDLVESTENLETSSVSQRILGDVDNNRTIVFHSGLIVIDQDVPETYDEEHKITTVGDSDSQKIDLDESTEDPETSSVSQKNPEDAYDSNQGVSETTQTTQDPRIENQNGLTIVNQPASVAPSGVIVNFLNITAETKNGSSTIYEKQYLLVTTKVNNNFFNVIGQ